MDMTTILYLYIAFLIVITIHEIGHFPKKIKFKFGLFPKAVAMQSRYRYGGLATNIVIVILVAINQPSNVLLQYIGLAAWIHFILYTFFGSILPELKESMVDIRTHVFDDIPNKLGYIFIPLSFITFLLYKDYYLPILRGLF